MRKIKLLSLVVCVCMLCAALTGCIGMTSNVKVNEDGSGEFTVFVGYTEEGLEMLNSMAEEPIDTSALSIHTYNGVNYYGEFASETFATVEEFNDKIVSAFNSNDGVSLENNAIVLSRNSYGSFILNVNCESDTTSDIPSSSASTDPEEQAMMEALLKDMVIALDFEMPYNVKMLNGGNVKGVKLDGNKVSINYLELTEYVTNENPDLKWIEIISEDGDITLPTEPEKPEEVPSQPETSAFNDVKVGDWYFTAVNEMAKQGMVAGVGNGNFNPNGKMTYAEFATIVARANNVDLGDINGYWAGKAIEYCKDWTYIKDLGDIKPANYDIPVPREVAVAGAYRMARTFLQDKDTSITELSIPDYNDIDEQYRNDILFGYQSGLTHGMDAKGTFNPKATLTRAELCQLLYNAGFILE